jgi:hypothetical protein
MLDSLYSSLDWILRELGLLGANPELIGVLKPLDWLVRQTGHAGLQGILGPANHLYWLGEPKLAMASVMPCVWRMPHDSPNGRFDCYSGNNDALPLMA